MEAADDCSGGADRIGMIEPGIGGGDRHFGNDGCVQCITEIDQAGDLVVVGLGDQHVPVVGVVVNDGGAKGREPRRDGFFEAGEEPLEQSAVFSGGDVVQPVGRAAGVTDVPVEIAQRPRMHEAFKRCVEAAEHLPERLKCCVAAPRLGKRQALDPADEAQAVGDAARTRGRSKARAFERRADMRHRQIDGMGSDVAEQCRLEIAFDCGFGTVDDLEDVGVATLCLDLEVLVAFAGKQREQAFEAVMLLQQRRCRIGRKVRRRRQHIVHGDPHLSARVT
ncbi:hypothetical protein D9M70_368810 [compost metagenome]